MVALGYLLESYLVSLWSAVLLTLYTIQVAYDHRVNQWTRYANNADATIFKRIEPVGLTRKILHYGGWLMAVLLVIRSLDPAPVLGIYSDLIVDYLSHTVTAILFVAILESLLSVILSIVALIQVKRFYWFGPITHFTCLAVCGASLGTNILFHLGETRLLYTFCLNLAVSCGATFLFMFNFSYTIRALYQILPTLTSYVTRVQEGPPLKEEPVTGTVAVLEETKDEEKGCDDRSPRTELSFYQVALKEMGERSRSSVMTDNSAFQYNSAVELIYRLITTFKISLAIIVVIWSLQIYFIITNLSKHFESPNPQSYSLTISFMYVQLTATSLMLWFSWVNESELGVKRPISAFEGTVSSV